MVTKRCANGAQTVRTFSGRKTNDSAADHAPWLGPGLPVYPPHYQILRVTGPAVVGANVFPSLTQQFTPPLGLRDREACYLMEPNGVSLGPGYYDARLVGSFGSLPLYVTQCCPTSRMT